jgi:segregation and condensation protein A
MSAPATPPAGLDLQVELPIFSGPFRLLAELIMDQKVDVCDVPVARVTDAFVQRGREAAAGWTLEEATWFLAVCAMLLELKVGRLLPRAAVETEEDLLGAVSLDLLYARSLELAAFQQIAVDVAERLAAAALLVPRTAAPPPEFAHLYPDVLENVTPALLAATAAALLAPPPEVDLSHVAPIRVSLSDSMAAVQAHLAAVGEARFRDLLVDCPERIHVVVKFLALLELHRQGKIHLEQAELFGEIEVRWRTDAPPPDGEEWT